MEAKPPTEDSSGSEVVISGRTEVPGSGFSTGTGVTVRANGKVGSGIEIGLKFVGTGGIALNAWVTETVEWLTIVRVIVTAEIDTSPGTGTGVVRREKIFVNRGFAQYTFSGRPS